MSVGVKHQLNVDGHMWSQTAAGLGKVNNFRIYLEPFIIHLTFEG